MHKLCVNDKKITTQRRYKRLEENMLANRILGKGNLKVDRLKSRVINTRQKCCPGYLQ